MNYNALWFDDEYDIFESQIDDARKLGIILTGFKNAKEGINELENNLHKYDAIIVDGMFLLNENQISNVPSDDALGIVARYLDRIENKKKMPWFILSGRPEFLKNENKIALLYKDNKVYNKNEDNDWNQLWQDIKTEANNQPDTQLRHKYHRVFELCIEKYFGVELAPSLLAAIKLCEEDDIVNTKDSFTGLRKIMESLFTKLHEIGLIPDEIYDTQGWFNPTSFFLAGKHTGFSINDDVVHPTISHLIGNIVQITQDASHSVQEKLRLKVDDFVADNQTPYLYRSTLNQIFDVLIWFKKFIDKHPDKEANTLLWAPFEKQKESENEGWIGGLVIKIAENGWGTFKPDNAVNTISIPPNMVKDLGLNESDKIYITTKPDPSGTKTYIDKINKSTL